jgi:hypothetical protein
MFGCACGDLVSGTAGRTSDTMITVWVRSATIFVVPRTQTVIMPSEILRHFPWASRHPVTQIACHGEKSVWTPARLQCQHLRSSTHCNHSHHATSRRTPDPHLTALPPPFPHRSPRRSSTNAACGGLIPSPAGRHRRANNPSSLAQHHIKKLGLHRTPLCVRDTRGLKPPPAERLRRAHLHLLHSCSHQQNPIYIGFSLLRTRRTIMVSEVRPAVPLTVSPHA